METKGDYCIYRLNRLQEVLRKDHKNSFAYEFTICKLALDDILWKHLQPVYIARIP